jgi:hypothetical protein
MNDCRISPAAHPTYETDTTSLRPSQLNIAGTWKFCVQSLRTSGVLCILPEDEDVRMTVMEIVKKPSAPVETRRMPPGLLAASGCAGKPGT